MNSSIFSSEFLIGAAIGSGITALAAERGDVDFLLAINAGRLRNMGVPSIACMLPVFDAATLTTTFAREELTQCHKPVLLGVNVWGESIDPQRMIDEIRDCGFAGAVNFPSCMHYSRSMQQLLSRAGRGIEQEVALLRAVKQAGLVSMFYCATRTQARLAADAGIDLVCLNLGWNVGGAMGHRSRATLEEVATIARGIGRLIKRINPETRFLLEGGPIETGDDLGRIVSLAPIDGYVGGSTIERIPLESSVSDQIDRFRQASKQRMQLTDRDSRIVSFARKSGFVGCSKSQLAYLHRLSDMSSSGHPLLCLAETGIDIEPMLSVLKNARRPQGEIYHVDVGGEEYPARARQLLFGHSDSEPNQLPLLADPDIGLLVIHAPQRLPAATQRRLAQALTAGVFRTIGTRRSHGLHPRVILVSRLPLASSHVERNLIEAGIDQALLVLMKGGVLRAPPVRERIDDLVELFEKSSSRVLGRQFQREWFSASALRQLHAYRWPGNDTEVDAFIGSLAGRPLNEPLQRQTVMSLLDTVHADEVGRSFRTEKDQIVDALWRNGFNRGRTAQALGVSRKTLYNKLRRFGLNG